MSAIVCDTGPLLAVLNDRDKLHKVCVALFDDYEACYLAQTQVGPHAEARFLDSIVAGELTIGHPAAQDWSRITQLVRQYAGFPLGVADASVIATAERLGVRQLASIDNRHMRAVTPIHCDAFDLRPG